MRDNSNHHFATLDPRIHQHVGEAAFSELLRIQGPCSEEALAAIIEADGRARLERGLDAPLEMYLTAVPALDQMTVALDSAIDMALRSLAGGSAPSEQTVEALVRRFPHMDTAIREAAMLGHALHTTAPARPNSSRYAGRLPCDFGPLLPDGRPQYVFQRLLGRGAFGEVYLAQDRLLSDEDRPALAAIKLLAGGGDQEGMRFRLADEATKARRVDHPNVVRVIARGRAVTGEDFVVYEYVEGANLQEHVRRTAARMSARDAVRLVIRVARGVQAAHAAGLVHRDLKPGNILIDASGQPRITDFGVATRENALTSAGATDGERAGTLAFMAPEQFSARLGPVGPPADIFALAGLLVWLLLGRPPYGATPEELMGSHLEASKGAAPFTLANALKQLNPTLAFIARGALQTSPRERTSSAAQLADELSSWLERRPLEAMDPSIVSRARLWTRRRPAAASALVLAVLVTLVGAVVALRQRDASLSQAAELRTTQELLKREEYRRQASIDAVGPMSRDMTRHESSNYMSTLGLLLSFVFSDQLAGYLNASQAQAAYDARVNIVDKWITKIHAASDSPTLESMFLWTLGARWACENGEWERPLRWLAECRMALKDRFPGDPWERALDCLELIAIANRAMSANPPDLEHLKQCAERLEATIADADYRFVIEPWTVARMCLDRLYGPQALNRPELVSPIQLTANHGSPAPAPASK